MLPISGLLMPFTTHLDINNVFQHGCAWKSCELGGAWIMNSLLPLNAQLGLSLTSSIFLPDLLPGAVCIWTMPARCSAFNCSQGLNKSEGITLHVWVGRFYIRYFKHLRIVGFYTYEICAWSGELASFLLGRTTTRDLIDGHLGTADFIYRVSILMHMYVGTHVIFGTAK